MANSFPRFLIIIYLVWTNTLSAQNDNIVYLHNEYFANNYLESGPNAYEREIEFVRPNITHSQNNIIVHLHNDFSHDNYLYRGLENKVGRMEVDVHPFKDQLIVSHNRIGLGKKLSFQAQYIDPLKRYIDSLLMSGIEFEPITVMLDLKSFPRRSVDLLRETIQANEDYIYKFEAEANNEKQKIRLILSGNLPIDHFETKDFKYFKLDGRFYKKYPDWIKPHISSVSFPYSKAVRKSNGDIKSLIRSAHHYGMKVRFYKTKNNVEMWNKLKALGVDYLNVDKLEEYLDPGQQ